jgi:hypothetical protein
MMCRLRSPLGSLSLCAMLLATACSTDKDAEKRSDTTLTGTGGTTDAETTASGGAAGNATSNTETGGTDATGGTTTGGTDATGGTTTGGTDATGGTTTGGTSFGTATSWDFPPITTVVERNGLKWHPAIEELTYDDAVASCAKLGARLPTITELRTLIAYCPNSETGGGCQISETCAASTCDTSLCDGCGDGGRSILGHDEPVWSSTEVPDQPNRVWCAVYRYNSFATFETNATRTLLTFCVEDAS